MTAETRAYGRGAAEAFEHCGITKEAAVRLADTMTKSAALFNFSDYNDPDQGFKLRNLAIPLLSAAAAAAAGGYIAYKARDNGVPGRSAFDNIKNYLIGSVDKITRRNRPRPIYDIDRYIEV